MIRKKKNKYKEIRYNRCRKEKCKKMKRKIENDYENRRKGDAEEEIRENGDYIYKEGGRK
jgi:hypothetical protein